MKNKNILILGCGWAGKITAHLFLENNANVWGSTTQDDKMDELKSKGISPVLLDFSQNKIAKNTLTTLEQIKFDFIVISVPVRRNEDTENCLEKFKNINQFLLHFKDARVVYLSSIGVYEPINGAITETSLVKEDGNIFMIEEFLRNHIKNLVILRLGGLFGYGRVPGRYFSNKICSIGQEKANYVHGTDVAKAILTIFKNVHSHGTYNLVAPDHPIKEDVFKQMAIRYNFLPVLFGEDNSIQKEVSSAKIMNELEFTFEVPSPLDY